MLSGGLARRGRAHGDRERLLGRRRQRAPPAPRRAARRRWRRRPPRPPRRRRRSPPRPPPPRRRGASPKGPMNGQTRPHMGSGSRQLGLGLERQLGLRLRPPAPGRRVRPRPGYGAVESALGARAWGPASGARPREQQLLPYVWRASTTRASSPGSARPAKFTTLLQRAAAQAVGVGARRPLHQDLERAPHEALGALACPALHHVDQALHARHLHVVRDQALADQQPRAPRRGEKMNLTSPVVTSSTTSSVSSKSRSLSRGSHNDVGRERRVREVLADHRHAVEVARAVRRGGADIALSTRLEPDGSGRWMCSHTLGSSAWARITSLCMSFFGVWVANPLDPLHPVDQPEHVREARSCSEPCRSRPYASARDTPSAAIARSPRAHSRGGSLRARAWRARRSRSSGDSQAHADPEPSLEGPRAARGQPAAEALQRPAARAPRAALPGMAADQRGLQLPLLLLHSALHARARGEPPRE